MRARIVLAALAFATGCSLLSPLGEGEYSDGNGAGDAGAASSSSGETARDAATSGDGAPSSSSSGDAAAASPYVQAVLADAPILYVRFADPPGTKAAARIGTAGTYLPSGVTYGVAGAIPGDSDTAVSVDGSGAITFPAGVAAFDGTKPYTVELWVKPAATVSGLGIVVDNTSYDAARAGWMLHTGSDDTGSERWVNGATQGAAVGAALAAGAWHHVVSVFTGDALLQYADGQLVGKASTATPLPTRSSQLYVGKQSCMPCAGTGFTGGLDELAIYDKAFVAAQVMAHYQAAK